MSERPAWMPTETVDVGYVVSLSKRHADEIGFIPKPKLEQYAQNGQIWMQHENDEACGFLVWGNGWPILRVYQVCIQYDARRRENGFSLIRRLIKMADNLGYQAISCWVASDIEANSFWRACGFTAMGTKAGGKRRGRVLIRWEFVLPNPIQRRFPAELAALVPPHATDEAERAADAATPRGE